MCGSISYEPLPCLVNGQQKFCEQSFVDPTCAPHTPIFTPSGCTPSGEQPHSCCTPESYGQPPLEYCRWNCGPDQCATGTAFADQSSRPIRHLHVELDRLKLTLTEWVVREENPREGRYAVMLLCLCCHESEHAGV